MTGEERKALSFVAILLGLSAVARAVNRPDPVIVAGASAVDIETRLNENQQVRERLSKASKGSRSPAKSPPPPKRRPPRPVVIDNRPPKAAPAASLNVNRASVEELDALPGVSPAVAQRIVEYRETRGYISSLEQLDSIKGVGPALLTKLRPIIKFH